MNRLGRLAAFVLLVLGLVLPASAQAQTDSQFFPETGYAVSGRFLEYWREHGGLAVFGLPISSERNENGRIVQYFERQRFEYALQNARPYDVLLGRLGAELLATPVEGDTPSTTPGCIYFPDTQQNVCDQQPGIGFASYWQRNGLEFDGQPNNKSYAESLALFGFPLTGVIDYVSANGTLVKAQWFERARFEWHPDNPDAFKVLLGRLGAEILPEAPAPGPGPNETVELFLISVDDTTSSTPIGCGDSVVPVTVRIPPTLEPLGPALERLLSLKDPYYGATGLYNALYQSNLRLDNTAINNGVATVALSGDLIIGGVCDAPRVQAQLEQTVRQFPFIQSVTFTVNGRPLADVLGER